ncbi:MAG TPA: hypothetical protein VGQ57_09570, partial [Polyangiaceae bacterium]|nr:hypothetical protein [Polyangiaceae bacterium]
MRPGLAFLATLPTLGGCGATTPADHAANGTLIAEGRALFALPTLSTLDSNRFACSTCHAAHAGEDDILRPGAPLAGATLRPTFWNDQENDLLEAVNVCVERFMQSGAKLAPADRRVEALYSYLASLEPGDASPQAFSIVGTTSDVARGNADAGANLFARS